MQRTYRPVSDLSITSVEALKSFKDEIELGYAIRSLAYHGDSPQLALDACRDYIAHPSYIVRIAVMQTLGFIARFFDPFPATEITSLANVGVTDKDARVVDAAKDALYDIKFFSDQ